MKLIFVVPSFYDDRLHRKVKNGQAVIAGELCRNFSSKIDVLVSGYPVRGKDLKYANLISTKTVAMIRWIRVSDLMDMVRIWRKSSKKNGNGIGIKDGIKNIFYKALGRKFVSDAKHEDWDVVAIHDFGPGNMEVLKKCIENDLKCVVTLHMYVGKGTTLEGKMYLNRAEREKYLIEGTDVPITVVSSGIKRRILEDYRNVSPDRITIIPNGTSLSQIDEADEERMRFLCIGTISARKNQIQLLSSLKYIPEGIRSKIKILFVGEDSLDGQLQKTIKENGFEDMVEYVGAVEHEKLRFYYKTAFAVISTSLNEAFGLTFIEGFVYGLPAVFFDDIDSANELYDQDAVELIHGKRDQDIAEAIIRTVNGHWNKVKIRKHGMKFDIKRIAAEYEKLYEKQKR